MFPVTQANPPAGLLNLGIGQPAHNILPLGPIQQATAAGCRALNGSGMLLYQGAQAFTLWTGQQPDLAIMRQALMGG
jgi:hypothetical protein